MNYELENREQMTEKAKARRWIPGQARNDKRGLTSGEPGTGNRNPLPFTPKYNPIRGNVQIISLKTEQLFKWK